MTGFSFEINAKDSSARQGVLSTPRGEIRTPAFMPVGTAGSVKGLYTDQVEAVGSDIILGNTYHLMLRPGAKRVNKFGGLHDFMNWSKPILTDSGGYQVFSLSKLRSLSEEGVKFQSHIDGREYLLTPERSIEIQADLLKSDIIMQFDECTPYPCTEQVAEQSMRLSLRWAKRSKERFGDRIDQNIFGIVQGSVFKALREESAEELIKMDFDGYAIGGLAVGEGHELMCQVLDDTVHLLPSHRPRYLMGVGRPIDILDAVKRGVDLFDCVIPTRSGRHGQFWTDRGSYNIKNACYAEDNTPLDASLSCPASQEYSKAYLHHLFKSKELLGPMLLSWYNIAYYQHLMKRIRAAINESKFPEFYNQFYIQNSHSD